jgi:hypothetical protein
LKLETVESFRSSDVMVIGGDTTNYVCEYKDNYVWIINIISEQSFTLDGGILNVGNKNNSININAYHYFVIMSGVDGYFHIRHIKIIFVSKLNIFIYIEGGTIFVEDVKISNETTQWVRPLIYSRCLSSSVIIELSSLIITDCYYLSTTGTEAGVVYFHSAYSYLHPILLNISSLYFQNNAFYINTGAQGGAFFFSSNHYHSCL